MKLPLFPASFFAALALPAAMLVSGCASSERMNRLSYDSDSYSAPKSARIAGGKFDDALVSLRTPVGLKDRQVNIWPFCTVNSRYVSILWPFIDWDDFGMAVRPFYNQEGNDCSILFPLSSWNTQDRDGWALNAYWDRDCYGMFPLFHVGKAPGALWFAGPFVGGGKRFGIVPLFFIGREFRSIGPLWWVKDDLSETMPEKPLLPFSCGIFPLFWKFGDANTLFPLYLKTHDTFISPLLWMEKDLGEDGSLAWTDGQYIFLGYWRDDWKRHGFFPFYNVNTRDDDAFNHVLLWWWDHNDPDCGLFPFAWFDGDGGFIFPFGGWENKSATHVDGSEETLIEGNILLLGYWGHTAWGAFPFFRGSSAEEDMKYVGPVWWAYDSDEREYGFFPFFRVERSRGETNLSYLFPAYYWSKDDYGSEFNSIPFARKDYEYPEYRVAASERERRYLLYSTYKAVKRKFNNEGLRDDYSIRWGSASYRADKRKLMEEQDLTEEEAERTLDDQIVSTSEERRDALLPFFEWSRSDDGYRDLSFLFYLFDFERSKTSYSNSILWHILFSNGGKETTNLVGLPESSSHLNILGVFPGYSSEKEYSEFADLPHSGFYRFAADCAGHYLRRAAMKDGSEESENWSQNLRERLVDFKYIPKASPAPGASQKKQASAPTITAIDSAYYAWGLPESTYTEGYGDYLPNEVILRICGIDRAISGEMTAKEAAARAKDLMEMVMGAFHRAGVKTSRTYGFFPLFLTLSEALEKAGQEKTASSETLTLLTDLETGEDGIDFSLLLGILGHYTDEVKDKHINGAGRAEKSASLLTLLRTCRESRPVFNGTVSESSIEKLAMILQEQADASENPVEAEYFRAKADRICAELLNSHDDRYPSLSAALAAYRSGARTAADAENLLKALTDYENEVFEGDNVDSSSGFYPFVFWQRNYMDHAGETRDISKSWFVLPLLSGGSKSENGSSLGILCPLLYFGATKVHDQELPHPSRIVPADVNFLQASHSYDAVKGENDHYALFLVGTGKEVFMQWKQDADKLIPAIYGTLYQLKKDVYYARFSPDEIDAKAAEDTKRKINSGFTRWNSSIQQVDQYLARLGMKPLDRKTTLEDSIMPLLHDIVENNVQMRTVSSFNTGWGLTSSFFGCRETGDYQSKVLFGLLANNQKLGAKEHRSYLGYLYNMDTDGVNTRKFIFPFITTKDAPGFHEWSFLGGLFERSEENGETGGRIFFFPYGHRPGK